MGAGSMAGTVPRQGRTSSSGTGHTSRPETRQIVRHGGLIPVEAIRGQRAAIVNTACDSVGGTDQPGSHMEALAAVEAVLRAEGNPLHYREITSRILKQQLWHTERKTPEASINAMLAVDIQERGADSRFRRTDRGVYDLNGSQGEEGPVARITAPVARAPVAAPTPAASATVARGPVAAPGC